MPVILAQVPTGTVLLVTTTASLRRCGAIAFDHAPHGRQIRRAIGALRRADGQIDDIGRLHRRRQVGGEVQPLGLDVVLDQLGQARLVDRNLAAVEAVDLLLDRCRCRSTSLPLSAKQVPVTRPT